MSSFNCEKCDKALLDTPYGGYITECEHYPRVAQKACACTGLRRRNQGLCLVCEIKALPDTFPAVESNEMDRGAMLMKFKILKLIENEK